MGHGLRPGWLPPDAGLSAWEDPPRGLGEGTQVPQGQEAAGIAADLRLEARPLGWATSRAANQVTQAGRGDQLSVRLINRGKTHIA